MHPDLEALLQAYDAALEAGPRDSARRHDEFEQRVKDLLSRTPGVGEDSLRNAIRLAYSRWLAKQKKPSALPPKARSKSHRRVGTPMRLCQSARLLSEFGVRLGTP